MNVCENNLNKLKTFNFPSMTALLVILNNFLFMSSIMSLYNNLIL